jgi:phosphoglycerate kinase
MKIQSIKDLDIINKRVFLRVDLNISTKNIQVENCFKFNKIISTLQHLIDHNAKIILATHIGRPEAHTKTSYFDENLSTKKLLPLFKHFNFATHYQPDLHQASIKSKSMDKNIILLENIRFFNGEQGNMNEKNELARLLKNTADIYINDAFALIHRNDTSISLLPQFFEYHNKGIGLLMQQEITTLQKFTASIKKPFTIILGGNKEKTKLPLLLALLIRLKPNYILTGSRIGMMFNNQQTIADTLSQTIISIKNLAKKQHCIIKTPLDIIMQNTNHNYETVNAHSSINSNNALDIGPQTIKSYKEIISKSAIILLNGSMGKHEIEELTTGTKEIFGAIKKSPLQASIAGGGDTIKAINKFNCFKNFFYLSTGGGATLAFLASENLEKFPAYKFLIKKL